MLNDYKVPKKQWKKWCKPARAVFENLYGLMWTSPHLFKHPKTPTLSGEEWKTVCWNAAWMAADLVQEEIEEIKKTLK